MLLSLTFPFLLGTESSGVLPPEFGPLCHHWSHLFHHASSPQLWPAPPRSPTPGAAFLRFQMQLGLLQG